MAMVRIDMRSVWTVLGRTANMARTLVGYRPPEDRTP